jgi:hypothetical protein
MDYGRSNRLRNFTEHPTVSLLFFPFASTWPKLDDKPFHRHLKCIADSKKGEDSAWPSSLDHLPVAHTEPEGNHVFLAQFPFGPEGPHTMAQCAKKTLVLRRKLATGTHYLRLESWRTKSPRTKLRIVDKNTGF